MRIAYLNALIWSNLLCINAIMTADRNFCTLYRHFDRNGKLLYIGVSHNALIRLKQHEKRRTCQWYWEISQITLTHYPSRIAAMEAELAAISSEKPLHNVNGRSCMAIQSTPTKPVSAAMTADEFKALRAEFKTSQAVFGTLFGVNQSTIHRWETVGPPTGGWRKEWFEGRLAAISPQTALDAHPLADAVPATELPNGENSAS